MTKSESCRVSERKRGRGDVRLFQASLNGETMLVIDSPTAETRPSPRCTVCFEGIPPGRHSTAPSLWAASATVSAAWDAIDRAATSRAALASTTTHVRGADADEREEAAHDDGGDPDHRQGRSRFDTARSPTARERRGRRCASQA